MSNYYIIVMYQVDKYKMAKQKAKRVRINAFIGCEQHEEVLKMAARKGITFSEILRRSIEFYLEDQYEKYRRGERK